MKKNGLIIILGIVLFFVFLFIGYEVIKESQPSNKDEGKKVTKASESSYEDLVQNLTCSGVKPLYENEELVGSEIITYHFSFKGSKFESYKKEILLSFNDANGYQNYCLSCDNTEANDIKSITKGININITNYINKYIYEIVDIDIARYDGEFKETKYGLDGLTKKSDIDDALYLTRDMICYWK